jgi:hypothetical protein
VNTDELESALFRAELRVLKIQTKLHRWARSYLTDHGRGRSGFARSHTMIEAMVTVAW